MKILYISFSRLVYLALSVYVYALGSPDEYCLSEIFQPRCLKNEVILMKSATYGRMRIGRCITAEEVDEIGSHYLGCSVDVLPQLDKKCSGKIECDIRIVEISVENVKPCSPHLRFHLEASYDCITGKPTSSKSDCALKRVQDIWPPPFGRQDIWAPAVWVLAVWTPFD